jgi:uncharacterized repeat protein (TIGR02543 family)
MGSVNVTLYAQWSAHIYSVTYDGNGYTGGNVPVDSTIYIIGNSVTVLGNTGNLVNYGHSFAGWNTKADGTGTDQVPASNFIMDSASVVLYAKWVPLPRYTITYDGNGNSGGNVPVDATTYFVGTIVTVLGNTGNLTKIDHAFMGWNTKSDGTGTNRTAGSTFTMGSANETLYAKWSPTYTITYNGNGNLEGDVPVDSTRYLSGATITVLGNTGDMTKTGYAFAGWNTEANGSGISHAVASTFILGSASVTLYAKWGDYLIGETGPAGGLVFYDSGNYYQGWRYLEAAPSDQSEGIVWWNGSNVTTGTAATMIGSGSANTTAIIAAQGTGSYAASLCANLVLGGYDDWFLPSKDELNQMYQNLKVAGRGGFESAIYWSSSGFLDNGAWNENFSNGQQQGGVRYFSSGHVRAVRAF